MAEPSTCTDEGSAPAGVRCTETAALWSQQTSALTPGTVAVAAAGPRNLLVAAGGTRTLRAVAGPRCMQFAPLVYT